MHNVDPIQFGKDNTLLFQKDRWFIFLDLGDSPKNGMYPRLAHRCKIEDRMKHMAPREWSMRHTCCLVIVDNEVCRDCRVTAPKVFRGFFNLTKWSWE